MSFDLMSLVTDRTAADVAELSAAIQRILNGKGTAADIALVKRTDTKGGYYHTDLNRVGMAVDHLAERLRATGYKVDVSPRWDWKQLDEPSAPEIAAYLRDIRTMRGLITMLPATPPAPEDEHSLTWAEANHIEQILLDLDTLITNMIQAWFYTGDIFAGEI